MDELDTKIIALLQRDGRASNAGIAMEASSPTITTTISNSMSVNPRSSAKRKPPDAVPGRRAYAVGIVNNTTVNRYPAT